MLREPFDQGDVHLIQPAPMLKIQEQEGKTSCSDQGVSQLTRGICQESLLY